MTTAVVVGANAPDFAYTTAQGEAGRMADLWAEGPALILWLRHFG